MQGRWKRVGKTTESRRKRIEAKKSSVSYCNVAIVFTEHHWTLQELLSISLGSTMDRVCLCVCVCADKHTTV